MSESIIERFSCETCQRSYAWKTGLAGKRVTCKCGAALTVPQAVAAADTDEHGLYDFAAIEAADALAATRATARADADAMLQPRIMPIAQAAPVATPALAVPTGTSRPLGYAPGMNQRQQDRAAELNRSLVDMYRDVYVPLALLVGGLVLYIGSYAVAYNLGPARIAGLSVGVGALTAIKAILLILFAIAAAGPLGVSFGGPFTATLKLAAIAVFSDGCNACLIASLGKVTHGLGLGIATFPISLTVYWILMTYLFSMDPSDSALVVIMLTAVDFVLRTAVAILLMGLVMSMGGIKSSAAVPRLASSNTALVSPRTRYVNNLKDYNMLKEAKAYIAAGHQAALTDTVNGMYAAGATDVSFEVTRDINGKGGPVRLFVEMPQAPAARKKILDLRKAFYDANGMQSDPADLTDNPTEAYIDARIH